MEYKMVFSGFGGQGILAAGQLVAIAGMEKGLDVSWLPSYGPEMRGGAANCSVIISDGPIGSPIVEQPDILIAMNRPSLEKFEENVKPGGVIIFNCGLIKAPPTRKDVRVIKLDCNQIASALSSPKAVNMPILGVLMEVTGLFNSDDLKNAMVSRFESIKGQQLEINLKAVEAGRSNASM